MKPVKVSTTIACPCEEAFEYLADVANHAQFTDHMLVDWRLTREDSYGLGAGARYRIKRPGPPAYADAAIVEFEAPHRIVLAGRTGRLNRIPTLTTFRLEKSGGGTRIELELESAPATFADRLVDRLSLMRRMTARGARRALRRLAKILEAGGAGGERTTVSGGPRKPATGFRL